MIIFVFISHRVKFMMIVGTILSQNLDTVKHWWIVTSAGYMSAVRQIGHFEYKINRQYLDLDFE